MLRNPSMAALVAGSHLAKDLVQLMAPAAKPEARHECAEKTSPAHPICLDDAGWLDHYGHRHLDVDVERL